MIKSDENKSYKKDHMSKEKSKQKTMAIDST
jgi:hypothetical protein